jgi:hypothetical protein
VVQETVVAQKATIRYSNISAPLTMFSYAAMNYSRSRLNDNLDSGLLHNTQDPFVNFYRIIISIDSTRQDWLQYQPTSLLSLLRKFRLREASDERDKVFALLNLVRHWGPNGPLRPDYSLQPGEVWFKVTKDIITSSGCLDVLAGTLQGAGHSKICPSWITDWSASPQPHEFERVSRFTFYNASGHSRGLVQLHGRSTLEVQGSCVDQIKWHDERPLEGQVSRMRVITSSWRQRIEEHTTGDYIAGGSQLDAFWRTLCADILYSTQDKAGRAFQRSTAAGLSSYSNWCDTELNIERRTTIIDGVLQEPFQMGERNEDKNAFHYAVECASEGRKFFITSKGYMGIGPGSLTKGDGVYLFMGSRVPLILRRAAKTSLCHNEKVEILVSTGHETEKETRCFSNHRTFELLGDAYVHGIMDYQIGIRKDPLPETVFLT